MAFRSRRIGGGAARARPAPTRSVPDDDEFLSQFRDNPAPRQQPAARPRYEQGPPSARSRYARGGTAQTENYPREEYYPAEMPTRPVQSKYSRVRPSAQPPQPQYQVERTARSLDRSDERRPGRSAGQPDDLAETVANLKTTVNEWEKAWEEMSDSVFDMVCEVKVNNLPFYKTLPTNEEDLGSPQSTRLQRGQTIVVVYPQYKRANMLFMRMRKVNRNTGAIKSYFVPIKNFGVDADVLADMAGINTASSDFVGNFRLPGETLLKKTDHRLSD